MKKIILAIVTATILVGCAAPNSKSPKNMSDQQICYKSTHLADTPERILVKKELLLRGLLLKPKCQFYRAGGKYF